MDTLSIYSLIKQSLPEKDWSKVIRSLRYDPIIWESIQDPQFIEKLHEKRNGIADWSPANMGLICIDFNASAKDIQELNSPVLDDLLINKVMNLLEGIKSERNLHNIEESILVAMFIRDKLILGETWLSIKKEFLSNQLDYLHSIFACLYGLIKNPFEFLEEMSSIDNSFENYVLISHMLISNPLETDQEVNILTRLLTTSKEKNSLSTLDIYRFIQNLYLIYPELAVNLSTNIVNSQSGLLKEEIHADNSIVNTLRNLEKQLLSAELQHIVSNPDISQKHILTALKNLANVWGDLASKVQDLTLDQTSPQETVEKKKYATNRQLIDEWSKYESLMNHPRWKTTTLLRLLEDRQYIEAEQFIKVNEDITESGFITDLVLAINALNRGDQPQSVTHARKAVDEVFADNSDFIKYLTNYSESILFPLLELLIELDMVQEAIKVTQKAIYYRKSDVNLYLLMGEASKANYKLEDAVESYYNAMLLKPDDLNIRRQLALCLEDTGRCQDAYSERKYILEASEIDGSEPDLEDVHKLTECTINLGYFDEAIKLCRQAIKIDAENGYTYSLMGKALHGREDKEPARRNFEKGIQLSPQIPETWLSHANAQYSEKNISGAIETLQAALNAIPTSAEIHLALGELQLSQNALTEALTSFKNGAEIDPNNAQIALLLGTTLQLLGHLNDAENVLEKAHHRIPNHVGVADAYVNVLLQLGEKTKALPVLYLIVKSNPTRSESYLEFAEAVLSSRAVSDDQYPSEEVLNVIHKALEFDPENPLAHALLGEILIFRNDFLGAKDAYQVALESNLVEDEAWFSRLSLGIGRVSLALGQEDVALASLQEALQADPNNSFIHQALCEVYQAVNLPENALQSARTALNLAIDDVDTLTWYADQMLSLSEMDAIKQSQLSSNELLKQIQTEALNALHQANQIAPTHADLLVKLGRMQYVLGDVNGAHSTINRILEHEHANVGDLIAAGEILSELGDTCGAIACLEQAYNKERKSSDHSTSTLLIKLAKYYQKEGDNESAFQTLNRALEDNPSFGSIYSEKAKLLHELNNEDEAISCVLEGLDKSYDPQSQIQLHTLAGKIYRQKGEIKSALDHAQLGLSLCNMEIKNQEHQDSTLIDIISLTSDLFTAVLKPNKSRLLFKEMDRKYKIDINQDIDYCCSYVEFFLDSLGESELTSIISQLIEKNPNHPRILALQARIFYRRRDYHTSLQILHTALESANRKIWNPKDDYKTLTPITTLPVWYSLIDSALELYQWDTALYAVKQALELAPTEPRAQIYLARVMVMRAEYQRLCEQTDVITNSPGPIATSHESKAVFDKAISDAITFLQNIPQEVVDEETKSDVCTVNPIINRWKSRGLAIFGNDDEVNQAASDLAKLVNQSEEIKSDLLTTDIAALIGAEIRSPVINDDDKVDKLTHLAQTNMQDLDLYLQVALALSITAPQNSIRLLSELSATSQSRDHPLFAMSKALMAKLLIKDNKFEDAKSAIDIAFTIFQNEPKWHNLAATIYQKVCNIVEAIHHFEEAIRLEPHNIEHLLGLGKLFIENADIDSANNKRAIQALERACRLEPENPVPWFYLSRAYLAASDINQAASYADMAISLAPEDIKLINLRGEIALHQDNPQAALDFANEALAIDGSETQAVLIKSQALRDLGLINQALEVLESAMKHMDDPLALHIEYAILLNDVHGPQASIAALEHLVNENPDNPEILSLLAKNMAITGQIDAAITTAQRALQVSNGNQPLTWKADLHHLLGNLLFRTHQLDQAIHHLSESIALTPNFIDSYLELGRAQQERRQYRQALEVLQQATRIAPNDPRPHYQAGIALKEGKDYRASESMLRRAADLAPDDVNIRRQLAAVVALNLVHNPRSKRIVEG